LHLAGQKIKTYVLKSRPGKPGWFCYSLKGDIINISSFWVEISHILAPNGAQYNSDGHSPSGYKTTITLSPERARSIFSKNFPLHRKISPFQGLMGFICQTHRASPCVNRLSPFRAIYKNLIISQT
jgi:hypothetical protein